MLVPADSAGVGGFVMFILMVKKTGTSHTPVCSTPIYSIHNHAGIYTAVQLPYPYLDVDMVVVADEICEFEPQW